MVVLSTYNHTTGSTFTAKSQQMPVCRTFGVQHTESRRTHVVLHCVALVNVCGVLLPYVSLTRFGECAEARIHCATFDASSACGIY